MTDFDNLSPDELVESILLILQQETEPPLETVTQLHRAYTDAVRRVNGRLRECGKLLRQGHRSEALRLAGQAPDLLETAGQLDFPEISYWNDYIGPLGMSAAPALLRDEARDLNRGFGQQMSLEDLLKQHRLHALARSPLATRLAVLRQIVERDGDNELFRQDLRSYEAERRRQLAADIQAAIAARDAASLVNLERELKQPWQEPIGPELVAAVRGNLAKFRHDEVRREQTDLADRLYAASGERDLAVGRELRQRWDVLQRMQPLRADDPLWQTASPALDWLTEADQRDAEAASHEKAVRFLEHLLDGPRGEQGPLERAYDQVCRSNLPVSEVTLARYHQRIGEFDVTARRRAAAIGLAIISVTVLVILGVGGVAWWQYRAATLAGYEGQLAAMVEAGRLGDARTLVDRLATEDPTALSPPMMQKLVSGLAALETADANRLARLNPLRERIDTLLDKARAASPPAGPTWDAIVPIWSDIDQARAAWQTIANDHLVTHNDEKLHHARQGEQIKALDGALRDPVNTLFRQEFDRLTERAAALTPETLALGSVTLRKDLDVLGRRPPLHAAQREQLQSVERKIKALEARQTAEQLRTQAVAAVSQAIGNAALYRDCLARVAASDPGSARAQDVAEAIERDVPALAVLEAWNDFAQTWRGRDLLTEPADRVSVFRTEAAAWKERLQQPSLTTALDDVLVYADARQKQAESLAAVQAYFDPEEASTLTTYLRIEDPMRIGDQNYYLAQAPTRRGDKVVYDYYLDINQDRTKRGVSETALVGNRAHPLGGFDYDSPQKRLNGKIQAILAVEDDGGWEMVCLKVLEAIAEQEHLDPILQVIYIKDLGPRLTAPSPILATTFQTMLEQVARVQGLSGNWIDPADAQAASTRVTCRELIVRLQQAVKTSFRAKIQQALQDHPATVPDLTLTWVAWTRCQSRADQAWVLDGATRAKPGQWLAGLSTDPQGNALILPLLGQVEPHGITAADEARHREGQPVVALPVNLWVDSGEVRR